MVVMPTNAQTPGLFTNSQNICNGCIFIAHTGQITYNTAAFPITISRELFPQDYLREAFCWNARTQNGYGCDPNFIVAVVTHHRGEPGAHPAQEGGYYAPRAYIIATLDIGKIGDETETRNITIDASTPGTHSFTCPTSYQGLQANTNYRILVYAKGQRGRGGGWNNPLAWADFQTQKHPSANSYCG